MADRDDKSIDTAAAKAAKDRSCKYCGQAFTSSSLGRHLDLYIRERNPKAPDGIHDVDEIRKLRGGVTRRQPRGSLARRGTSTPAATPTAASRRSLGSEGDDDGDGDGDGNSSNVRSPVQRKESMGSLWPFTPGWQATGVMNDIPPHGSETTGLGSARRSLPPQRAPSRQQVAKAQFDMRQKVQDAMDTARAAELALREMISSWRAAKQFIDMNSMPFEFEPLSMDFPALTLQCLQPPPTLFSSTQHPTATSWSISPPGPRQYEALQAYFRDEFRKWKITCAAASTSVYDDLTYPPSAIVQQNGQEALRRAEKMTESLERQASEHLQSAYTAWDILPPQRRNELWILELARSVGRKQKDVDKLKETRHSLKQEVANLKTQVEQLNRLQQPREFKLFSPTTIPASEAMVQLVQEDAVERGHRTIGLSLEDRNLDLGVTVATAIDRWKSVIVSMRQAGGINAQKQLDATSTSGSTPPTVAGPSNNGSAASGPVSGTQLQQASVPTLSQPPPPRQRVSTIGSTTAAMASQKTPASEPEHSAAPTPDDMVSDQDADADAEMDDDDEGFARMNTSIINPLPSVPQQQTAHLEVARTRGAPMPRMVTGGEGSYGVNATRSATQHTATQGGGRGAQIHMSRSMSSLHMAALYGPHNARPDMGITLKGEPMYMD